MSRIPFSSDSYSIALVISLSNKVFHTLIRILGKNIPYQRQKITYVNKNVSTVCIKYYLNNYLYSDFHSLFSEAGTVPPTPNTARCQLMFSEEDLCEEGCCFAWPAAHN